MYGYGNVGAGAGMAQQLQQLQMLPSGGALGSSNPQQFTQPFYGPQLGNVSPLAAGGAGGAAAAAAASAAAEAAGKIGGDQSANLNFMDKAGLGMSALQTLLGGIQGFKALGLAKEQFNFNKEFAETNLANQTELTNQAIGDKYRSRAAAENRSAESGLADIAKFSLPTRG